MNTKKKKAVNMMNLEKMKQRKRELRLTNQEVSERSGVPLGTVNKIFSGETKAPKYSTMLALERVLGMYFYRDHTDFHISCSQETAKGYENREDYTIEDYYGFFRRVKTELIDGKFYSMEAWETRHQEILGELYYQVKDYLRKKKGGYRVYLPPFDVRLDRDGKTVVRPDLCMVGEGKYPDRTGLNGPPDFVAEIISGSGKDKDHGLKLKKYWNAGVREYWVIDLAKERIITYVFDGEEMDMKIYGLRDRISLKIFGDLEIDFGVL